MDDDDYDDVDEFLRCVDGGYHFDGRRLETDQRTKMTVAAALRRGGAPLIELFALDAQEPLTCTFSVYLLVVRRADGCNALTGCTARRS